MASKKKEAKGSEVQVQSRGKELQKAISPFHEMERMMETFFPHGWLRPLRWEWPEWATRLETKIPPVDVVDRAEDILVRAHIPGVEKDNLDVSVSDNAVTIRGFIKHEEKEEKGEYYRCEISRGEFARTVGLPSDVDGGKAKASFKDGVLELTLPKVAGSKRRTIKIE